MFVFFHSLGNDLVSGQFLKIRCNGFDIEETQSFIIRIEVSSWPWALFWSKDLIILTISSTQNSKDESLSLIPKFIFTGTVLSLDIGVHCLAKKLLNRSALSKKKLYLPVAVISVKSYYHLQMFSRWPNMFLGLFSGHLVYFVIFQYGRTYSIWYI